MAPGKISMHRSSLRSMLAASEEAMMASWGLYVVSALCIPLQEYCTVRVLSARNFLPMYLLSWWEIGTITTTSYYSYYYYAQY